jgi:hypothetical protein
MKFAFLTLTMLHVTLVRFILLCIDTEICEFSHREIYSDGVINEDVISLTEMKISIQFSVEIIG